MGGFEQPASLDILTSRVGVPVTRESIAVRGIRTSYLSAGYGPALLLIHGGGAGAVSWYPVLGPLSATFRLIVPDVVGFGETTKPLAYYNRKYFSQWLGDFLDGIGLQKTDLVAHSLGGAIAVQYALDHPERVGRLVLASSGGFGLAFPIHSVIFYIWLHLFPSTRTSFYVHRFLVNDPDRLDRNMMAYSATVCRRPGGKRVLFLGLGRAMLPFSGQQLASVYQQTLLIWGQDDRILPLAHGQAALRALPEARLVVIPNAGHIPFLDQPVIFNRLLINFLEAETC